MFDIGWSELLVIGAVALIAIGPKELPGVLRSVGQWVGKIKRMAGEFQGQFQEAMREAEVADLKKQFDEASSAATNFTSGMDNPLESATKQIEDTLKEATTMPALDAAPATPADIPPPPDIPAPDAAPTVRGGRPHRLELEVLRGEVLEGDRPDEDAARVPRPAWALGDPEPDPGLPELLEGEGVAARGWGGGLHLGEVLVEEGGDPRVLEVGRDDPQVRDRGVAHRRWSTSSGASPT